MRTGTGKRYGEEFKRALIQKVLNRGNRSVEEILDEAGGIHQTTLSRWIRESGMTSPQMSKKEKNSRQWNPQEKFGAVLEFERLSREPEKQGEFLRKSGLHAATVESWRQEMLGALVKNGHKGKRTPEEIAKDERIKALERDLKRKDQALAETTALLVLKKKAESIWGLVDDEESA